MINPSRCPPARYSSWRGNATNGSVTVSSKPVNENGDCIRIACYSIILCSQSNVIQTTLNRSGKPVKLIKGYFFPNDPPRLISFLSTVFGINVSLGTEPDGSVAFKTIAGQYEDKHSAYLYTFDFHHLNDHFSDNRPLAAAAPAPSSKFVSTQSHNVTVVLNDRQGGRLSIDVVKKFVSKPNPVLFPTNPSKLSVLCLTIAR